MVFRFSFPTALMRLMRGVTSVFRPYLSIFPMTRSGDPGHAIAEVHRGRVCVNHRKRWVPLCCPRFPSPLPGRQDFLLHSVTRLLRSCFVGHMYGSASHCTIAVPLPPRGCLIGGSFMTPSNSLDVRSGGLPWVRRTASPDTVQLHIQEASPDIRSRLVTTARPPLQRHIAGSLFATYLGLTSDTSYFLRTPRFW